MEKEAFYSGLLKTRCGRWKNRQKGADGALQEERRVQGLFEKPPSPVGCQLAQGGGEEETKLKLEQRRRPNGRETQTKALKKLMSNFFFFRSYSKWTIQWLLV